MNHTGKEAMLADPIIPASVTEPDFIEHVVSNDSIVADAAKLPLIEYDQQRIAIAEKLGIRASTLDILVRDERGEGEGTHGRVVTLPLPDAWADPVRIKDVLDELASAIGSHVIMGPASITVTALWIAHTWVFERFNETMRLGITSPTKRCGKSTLLDVLRRTCRCVLKADNITASGVFRTVESLSPLTLLIDEADSFLGENEELRGVLNSGFEKSGMVVRMVCIKDEWTPVQYKTFAPVALAAIGSLPGTLEDRALPIRLERKTAADTVLKFREEGAGKKLDDLASKLCRWAADKPNLARSPSIPAALGDREGDGSVALLSIADAAGGDWPGRARRALVEIFRGRAEQEGTAESGTLLLTDIKAVLDELGAERMTSEDICRKLSAMDDRPWPEWKHGKPMTPTQLARALGPFRVRPKNIKQHDGSVLKGYYRDAFEGVWSRYIPLSPYLGGDETATRYLEGKYSELSKNQTATGIYGSGSCFGKDAVNSSKVAGSGSNPLETGGNGVKGDSAPIDEVEL